MVQMVIERDGKTLRRGLTTGTCAAAAAKGAVFRLLGERVEEVEVTLPGGDEVTLEVAECSEKDDGAICCVVKDAGDDPDVTDGAMVCARVRLTEDGKGEVRIKGGEGIGRVTKPGLEIGVGEAAINPVPRKMIESEVSKVLPEGSSAEVTISVPGGEELARRTLNHKLGIEGGISIIGTTGIVEPWSDDAFMRSLVPQIDIALETGFESLVLVPGNIGERNALERGIPEDAVVQMGNYVGYMLKECARKGVKEVMLFGHQGKLVKVAGGIFNTHSKVADAKLEILAAHAAAMGASREAVNDILEAKTAEAALEVVRGAGLMEVYDRIAGEVSRRCGDLVGESIHVSAVILDLKGEIIGACDAARRSRWAGYLW